MRVERNDSGGGGRRSAAPKGTKRKKMEDKLIINLDEDPKNADWLHQIKKRKEAKMKYEEKYYLYLDDLRKSGVANMFGARPFLRSKFRELSDPKASKVLADWIATFAARHPKKEEAKSGQEKD